MKDRGTGEHKDYAFVAFKTKQVTQKAIEEIHSKESKVFTVLPKSFFLLFLTLILFLLLKNNKVVNEIHGSSTKKNKEYQEKLHVVVLRAEEIIFSKANFEVTFLLLRFLLTCLCTQLFYFMVCKRKRKIKMTWGYFISWGGWKRNITNIKETFLVFNK